MTGLEPLTESECWDRLRSRKVGRIGFDRGRGNRIHPVHYTVDSGAIYLTTSRDSELGMFSQLFAQGALVPFEIDQVQEDGSEQWSVLVRGRIDAPGDEDRPRPDDAQPPAGHDELVLRLTPVQVTGRRRTNG